MAQLKLKLWFSQARIWIFEKLMSLLGVDNIYRATLNEALAEIHNLRQRNAQLIADVRRLDQKNAIDVRGQLDLLNIKETGDIVWVRVSDERMLRHDVFNQIRDYLRGHGKNHSILLVTGSNVQISSLTEADLQKSGLKRMLPNERN